MEDGVTIGQLLAIILTGLGIVLVEPNPAVAATYTYTVSAGTPSFGVNAGNDEFVQGGRAVFHPATGHTAAPGKTLDATAPGVSLVPGDIIDVTFPFGAYPAPPNIFAETFFVSLWDGNIFGSTQYSANFTVNGVGLGTIASYDFQGYQYAERTLQSTEGEDMIPQIQSMQVLVTLLEPYSVNRIEGQFVQSFNEVSVSSPVPLPSSIILQLGGLIGVVRDENDLHEFQLGDDRVEVTDLIIGRVRVAGRLIRTAPPEKIK
jgi:hypothetical protein